MLSINVVPFNKCPTNVPSGQREHFCYSSANHRGREAGKIGTKKERKRKMNAAEGKDEGMDEWTKRRMRKDRERAGEGDDGWLNGGKVKMIQIASL